MTPERQTTTGTAPSQAWKADEVFKLFAVPARRKLVLALARQDRAACDLRGPADCSRDATLKHLAILRAEGFVLRKQDPDDPRRKLYSLVPGFPLNTTAKGKVLDFGFLQVPVGGAVEAERIGVQSGEVVWMPDVVYSAVGDVARRRILAALARTPGQTSSELKGVAGLKLDATLKHLIVLRSLGVVMKTANERDGRRSLYSLTPAVPVERSENGVVFNFGFCTVRLA